MSSEEKILAIKKAWRVYDGEREYLKLEMMRYANEHFHCAIPNIANCMKELVVLATRFASEIERIINS